ncbi:MAG: hypothetical protein IT581_15890, partial [Verrucomicrobiales bacterium]|nr:hypothetical protein [Verrucomicrobiales bacterium]
IPETTESFEVRFDRPSGVQLTRDHLQVTLEDNDLAELAFSDIAVTEGSASENAARILVTLSNPSPIEVGVDYATLSGTATSGRDFSPTQGHLQFAPGTTNATIIVPILDDALAEPTESFTVRLSKATNATVRNAESLVTILDDERPLPPTVSVLDASQNEGDDGWSFLPILLVLSSTNSAPGSVDLASAPESATAGQDFLTLSERVVFPAGTRTQTVFLTLVGDLRRETNETLAVVLSRPSNATLGRARAQITIRDDDGLRLRIDDLSVVVDRLNATQAVFQINLSEPATVPVTVDFATRDDTARAGEDYIARSGTLEITPGETNLLLAVPIAANARDEAEESFLVDFLNPTNASLATPFARATLIPAPPTSNAPPVVRLLSPAHREVRDLADAVTFIAQATDPDDGVGQVEFFANDRLVATVRQAPFEFVWNRPPAGDHECYARATDSTGATTDSQHVIIGVTEACGRAAILNNAANTEIDALTHALFELGVPWAVVEPAQATTNILAPFDLVVWCDDGAAPMEETEVRLLQELAASGKNLYFVGDQLLAQSNLLDANLQESWTQLLRLGPNPPDDAPNRVQLRHDHVQSDVEHPLLHGKAGAIADFDYPFAPETTRLTGLGGESVLGERGTHPVFIAFDAPSTPKARRQITQAFRVGGEDLALQSDRRRLFQNAVWWLLRCLPGDAFNLVPTLRSSTATAVAGQNFDLILEATVSQDCDGLAGRAECLLPADWQVMEVRIDQGSWSLSGRQLDLNLGRLPRGSLITAQITVRPGSAGPQPVRVRWQTLNESPQATADNTLDATVFVEDGIRLTLGPTASDTLQLVVQGRGRATYTIEAATDILGPWTVVTRLTPEAGSGTARWMVPVARPMTHRYFRAR